MDVTLTDLSCTTVATELNALNKIDHCFRSVRRTSLYSASCYPQLLHLSDNGMFHV